MLPECQSLVDELSASHSTDLQQRAYELQALLGLDKQAVETVMPSDASCEDIEIDRNLSFLNGYVQQAFENGAAPYIPESEREGAISISNYRAQDQQETSAHVLRFEAYELPKSSLPLPVSQASISTPTTDLVPVPEPNYYKEDNQMSRSQSSSDSLSGEFGVKLRLDGVQKKWGRPTYSSSSTPSSSTSSQQATNGGSSSVVGGSTSSQARESSYGSKRQQDTEVSAEKQRLAASLFGSSAAKADRRGQVGRKTAKESPSGAVLLAVAASAVGSTLDGTRRSGVRATVGGAARRGAAKTTVETRQRRRGTAREGWRRRRSTSARSPGVDESFVEMSRCGMLTRENVMVRIEKGVHPAQGGCLIRSGRRLLSRRELDRTVILASYLDISSSSKHKGMSWNSFNKDRYFNGQSGSSQSSGSTTDAYGGGQYDQVTGGSGGQYDQVTGGKKRQTSRLKKSSGKDDDVVDYPAAAGGYPTNAGTYSNGGYGNGYGTVTVYGNGNGGGATPYYGTGAGSYGGAYGDAAGSAGVAIPYNSLPARYWTPQDGTRSPMVINTNEVHLYGAPGSNRDGNNGGGERRRSGGFFRPALEAVGHFFDRKFGLHDRD
ncbi:hypothetical protein GUJ93_ZPchr0001g29267 [Zizania palustris]|uniref:Uncharacterized protein n=1 Tax=Zizania palustris TaxID=103762 RepID=A0A8J5RYL9_ZIZPA|nr:hypothetical protein GUJ93_ZPchr0001g29267 [Zizania palustris]